MKIKAPTELHGHTASLMRPGTVLADAGLVLPGGHTVVQVAQPACLARTFDLAGRLSVIIVVMVVIACLPVRQVVVELFVYILLSSCLLSSLSLLMFRVSVT
jgi:hypothetical protein